MAMLQAEHVANPVIGKVLLIIDPAAWLQARRVIVERPVVAGASRLLPGCFQQSVKTVMLSYLYKSQGRPNFPFFFAYYFYGLIKEKHNLCRLKTLLYAFIYAET